MGMYVPNRNQTQKYITFPGYVQINCLDGTSQTFYLNSLNVLFSFFLNFQLHYDVQMFYMTAIAHLSCICLAGQFSELTLRILSKKTYLA